MGDWTLPNGSVKGWVEAELVETGALAENVFQSPNSPFPFDDVAAGPKRIVICLDANQNISDFDPLVHCDLNWE